MSDVFSPQEIAEFRRFFPVTQKWIYLNHAAVAPISLPVAEAVRSFTDDALHEGFTASGKWARRVEQVRDAAARLLGASSKEIAFVKNTSHGISLVAQGLDWRPGDEVIVNADDFPSNVYPWMALEKQGVLLKKIPWRGAEMDLELLPSLLGPKTRLVSLSSAQYGNGYRLPVREIGRMCRNHGTLFFLDGIQTLGAFPLDLGTEPVDFLAADAHKWLLGPEGIGVFYLRKELLEQVKPVLLGWNSVVDAHRFDQIRLELKPNAGRFEEGSPSTLSIYALGAALDLLLQIGIPRISRRVLDLTDLLLQGLQGRNVEITCPLTPDFRSGIVTFRLPGENDRTEALERFLFSRKIYAAFRRGSLRLSPHFYNTEEEIEQTLKALDEFLAKH